MKQEELIRIAYRPDKTIEVMSDFSKKETTKKLIIMGHVLNNDLGMGIKFIRY